MHKHLLLLLAICIAPVLLPKPIFAQETKLPEVKDVIAKYLKAIGGEENLRQIENVVTIGKFSMGDGTVEGDFIAHQSVNKFVFKLDLPFGSVQQGYDGNVAWEDRPETGANILEDERRTNFVRSHEHPMPELTWLNDKGMTVTCTALVDIEGTPAYRLEFTPKEGSKQARFFDKESGLIVKESLTQDTGTETVEFDILISDYRKVGETVMAFKKIVASGEQQFYEMTIDEIKLNQDIEPSKFALPESVKKLVNEESNDDHGDEENDGGSVDELSTAINRHIGLPSAVNYFNLSCNLYMEL